ncbi:MAG: squalene/phytoene synthase family protein [Alphaproteobacteria bacterium]|nr:squalene/phytoene synthase family protein [Alphaproteobacteria bacterium]
MNLRDHDREHYLLSLFAPRQFRADMGVVMGYGFETAAIRARVRDRQVGAIRLAWWRDFLTTIYPPDAAESPNPKKSALGRQRGSHSWALHDQLAMICRHYHLPIAQLLAMIEIQLDAWEDDYFNKPEAIWHYAAATEGVMAGLSAIILSKTQLSQKSAEICRELGQIYGATRLLSTQSERLPEAHLSDIFQECQRKLQALKPLCGTLPKTLTPIRLMGLLAVRRLEHLGGCLGDVAAMKDLPSDPFLPLFMEFSAWRRKRGW